MRHLILSSLSVLCLSVSTTAVLGQTIPQNSTRGTGSVLNYQYGSRIYQGGEINTPTGSVIYPSTNVNHGNGSTTYYYPDGTQVTTNSNRVGPGGTYLTPGSLNGGLRNR